MVGAMSIDRAGKFEWIPSWIPGPEMMSGTCCTLQDGPPCVPFQVPATFFGTTV